MKNLSYSYRDIFKIAMPLMISNFFYTLIAITDVGFMKEVGVDEQAAIGYISLLYLILFMIGFSYTKGTQILIAQKIGQKKAHVVGKIVDNTFVVLFTAAILLFGLVFFFSSSFLGLIIDDQAVFDASYSFLTIRKWGFFLSFLGSLMIAFYSGIERTAVLAVAIITMSVTNIFLNWVLILGNLGFEPMGVEGAAWASNIAEGLSLLIMIVG
ncbi:MAG: MATE family efflux transporter, partial [Chitinophagales bacterium]